MIGRANRLYPFGRSILGSMAAPKRKPSEKKPGGKKPSKKKVVTAAVKHRIERARRDLATGKGITVGELLTKLLERDARKHAA